MEWPLGKGLSSLSKLLPEPRSSPLAWEASGHQKEQSAATVSATFTVAGSWDVRAEAALERQPLRLHTALWCFQISERNEDSKDTECSFD